MPYARFAPVDRSARLDLAERRWTAMLEAKPDLGSAVALQRTLLGLVIDLAAQFEGGVRLHGKTQLTAAGDEDDFGLAPGSISENISAERDTIRL
mgnify:CR=1 FL=1